MIQDIDRKLENLKSGIASKGVTPGIVRRFRTLVKKHYAGHGRDLPWRHTTDPYCVLVSEIMLQQTQVERVCTKFPAFIRAFPTFRALAAAPVERVLRVWQGMGYNRRALALRTAAQTVIEEFNGCLPDTEDLLVQLPGIGRATAASICAFAFDRPTVFVETNIRTVFLHLFFSGRHAVGDDEILPLVARTLDRRAPRDWYNGLMDLGVVIKKLHPNPARRSAHYTRQKPFEGSNRQLRSRVLKFLLTVKRAAPGRISRELGLDADKVRSNLERMAREGFVRECGAVYAINS